MTAWYESSFGRECLHLYAHRDAAEARADVRAVVHLLTPTNDEPLLDLFGAVFHALKQGKLLIGYLSRDYVIAHLVERDEQELPERHVLSIRHLTDGCQRVGKRIVVLTEDGQRHEYIESVRLYTRSDTVRICYPREGLPGLSAMERSTDSHLPPKAGDWS